MITWQIDDEGNHRLVSSTGEKGEWVGYNHICTLKIHGQLIIGASAYYDGTLPHEVPMQVTIMPLGRRERVEGTRPDETN